jgi:hypothetical protein
VGKVARRLAFQPAHGLAVVIAVPAMNDSANQNPEDLPIIELNPDAIYTIDVVAEITGISSQTILFYHEQGLIPATGPGEKGERYFDDEAIRALRRLDHLRTELGLKDPALKLMVNLLGEIEQLRQAARLRR